MGYMTGLSRTIINQEFMSLIDLFFNRIKPTRGPNKRNNSGRIFVQGSKSCLHSYLSSSCSRGGTIQLSVPFFQWVFHVSKYCVYHSVLVYQPIDCRWRSVLMCFITSTARLPCVRQHHVRTFSLSQTSSHQDPLAVLICFPRTRFTQSYPEYQRNQLNDGS